MKKESAIPDEIAAGPIGTEGHATPKVPKMANMLEGGGSTPICTPKELEDMGFKVVAYPLSLLACTVRAMENTLREIRDDIYGWCMENGAHLSKSATRRTSRDPWRTTARRGWGGLGVTRKLREQTVDLAE